MICKQFYFKDEDIQAVRVNMIGRSDSKEFSIKILVWLKNVEDPFTFSSNILEPEYKEIIKKGLFFNKKEKVLIKYYIEEAILKALDSENKSIYEYLNRLEAFYKSGFASEEDYLLVKTIIDNYKNKDN